MRGREKTSLSPEFIRVEIEALRLSPVFPSPSRSAR
jgi:hypothetical protein